MIQLANFKTLDFKQKAQQAGKIGMVHTLGDQSVEVLVVWSLDVEVPATDVVDSLVVDHEGAVGMLKGGVRGEDGVVGLDNGSRHLGSRIDRELELALLAVVNREAFHQQGSEAGSRAAAERVEDKEALKTAAVICAPGRLVSLAFSLVRGGARHTGNAANLIEDLIDQLLPDSVVTTSI